MKSLFLTSKATGLFSFQYNFYFEMKLFLFAHFRLDCEEMIKNLEKVFEIFLISFIILIYIKALTAKT